jgi:murein DD-endopeptidase MepM/ murein hydrolase activator NlpD
MCIFTEPTASNRFPASSGRRSGPQFGSRASELLLGDEGSDALTPRLAPPNPSPYQPPIPPSKPPLADRPLSHWNLHPIVEAGEIRGQDGHGRGDFGASRTGIDGKKKPPHGGVDIAVPAGTSVYSPAEGKVAIIILDAVHGLTGIQITTDDQRILKVLYVAPLEDIVSGVRVQAGQEIGQSQSLQKKYLPNASGKMTDHVHFQVERKPRVNPDSPPFLADPTDVVREWLYPSTP